MTQIACDRLHFYSENHSAGTPRSADHWSEQLQPRPNNRMPN